MVNITGTLVWYYYICKREVWLMSHELNPYNGNELLSLGRIIHEHFYKREKKEIQVGNMKIDLIKKEDGNIVIAEIKKSSKGTKAAQMQLLFYLYQLKKEGIKATGELLIPREHKKERVFLTEETEKELEKAFLKIKEIIQQPIPPELHKTHFCRVCAYKDLCFA
jgi:CRISPR-associated exonuclease Cas4